MKIKISQYKASFVAAIANSPMEIFLSLLFFILEMAIYLYDSFEIPYFTKFSYYYYSFFAVAFAFNIIFNRRRIYYYILSAVFPIIIYIYLGIGYNNTIGLIITSISSVLLIFTAYKAINNKNFTIKAVTVTLNIITSSILTLISALLIYSIIESIGYIFDISINNYVVQYGSIYIILPLLFLVLNYRNSNELKVDKFTDVMVNYILTPALLIYGVIVYCYFAKIFIIWQLPKGVVSITSILFLAIGIIVKSTRELTQKKIIDWFFKYISYISIPAITMLWIGTIYRICEYGLTENRIYLIITVAILTLWNFAQLWNKTNVYQYLTIAIIISFNTALYIPTKYNKIEKIEIEKTEIQEDNIERYYINSYKNAKNIDISGYRNLIEVNSSPSQGTYYKIDNDTIYFKTENDSVFMQIATKEIIDSVLIGVKSDFSNLNQQLINQIEDNPVIFRNDMIIMTIQSMNIEKKERKITLNRIGISKIITR